MFQPSKTANCESTDNELFFVPEGQSTYPERKALRRICGACVVKKECLDYALNYNVLGYWGDTTEHERNKIRRQLNIIPIPMYLTYQ
jgi:WhiB family redox-sensing transcriptional regulator